MFSSLQLQQLAEGRSLGNDATCQVLAKDIEEELLTFPISSSRPCIYRIPKLVRRRNDQDYTPLQLSIGPFHHNDESLVSMKVHKLNYLRSFLNDSKRDLVSYLQLLKDKEVQIRDCYADPTSEFSSDEFTKLLLIDSVFIIELFRRVSVSNTHLRQNDLIWGNPGLLNGVLRDICLAENQLPLFIIKALYSAAFRPNPNGDNINVPTFTDLACQFLGVRKSRIDVDDFGEAHCCHLLDMLRTHYLPSEIRLRFGDFTYQSNILPPRGGLSMDQKNIVSPTASRLSEASVVFDGSRNVTASLSVHFNNATGILSIPKLEARNLTESLLRNLVAFEQCHCHETWLTSYYFFMDCLINTAEDVRLLTNSGIIQNWLGCDEDLADLFNSLSKDIYLDPSSYHFVDTCMDLISYSNRKWNKHKAILKHTYFRHPWAVVSVIYAAILIVFTAIQVVTGILAVPGVRKGS